MKSPYVSGSVVESPVGLVLVNNGTRSNVMTVSYFSEVAHYPTRLWVSIEKTSYTHSLIKESNRFTLAILSEKQKDIALFCGSMSGYERDKCSGLDLYKNPSGFLFLQGSLASTACQIQNSLDVGTHSMFLADILEGEVDSRLTHLRHLLLSDL